VETAPGRSSAPWPRGTAAVSFEHQGAGRMGQNWGEMSENVGKPMENTWFSKLEKIWKYPEKMDFH